MFHRFGVLTFPISFGDGSANEMGLSTIWFQIRGLYIWPPDHSLSQLFMKMRFHVLVKTYIMGAEKKGVGGFNPGPNESYQEHELAL